MYMRRQKSGPKGVCGPREFAIRLITIRKKEFTFSYLDWFERTVLPPLSSGSVDSDRRPTWSEEGKGRIFYRQLCQLFRPVHDFLMSVLRTTRRYIPPDSAS